MGRRRYSPQQEADLVAMMAASAVLTGDKVVPQYTAVSVAENVPTSTLERMWKRMGEETRRKVGARLMREREDAVSTAGREWLDTTLAQIRENLPHITSKDRFSPEMAKDKKGNEYIAVPALRADQAARAYRDAHTLALDMGQRLGLLETGQPTDGPDLATAEGRDAMAAMVASLPPEVLAEALRRQRRED